MSNSVSKKQMWTHLFYRDISQSLLYSSFPVKIRIQIFFKSVPIQSYLFWVINISIQWNKITHLFWPLLKDWHLCYPVRSLSFNINWGFPSPVRELSFAQFGISWKTYTITEFIQRTWIYYKVKGKEGSLHSGEYLPPMWLVPTSR